MTSLEYTVPDAGSDGYWYGSAFDNSGTYMIGDAGRSADCHIWCRWAGVTIPVGATITNAYISLYQAAGAQALTVPIKFEDAANPDSPTTASDISGRTLTTASVLWTLPDVDNQYHNSGDIAAIIQELVDSYDYSGGAAMQCIIYATGPSAGTYRVYSGTTYKAKLYIEYTEAASGNPFYAYAQQ